MLQVGMIVEGDEEEDELKEAIEPMLEDMGESRQPSVCAVGAVRVCARSDHVHVHVSWCLALGQPNTTIPPAAPLPWSDGYACAHAAAVGRWDQACARLCERPLELG